MAQSEESASPKVSLDGIWENNGCSVTISGREVTVYSSKNYGGMGDFVIRPQDGSDAFIEVPPGSTLTAVSPTKDLFDTANDYFAMGLLNVSPSLSSGVVRIKQQYGQLSASYINNSGVTTKIAWMLFKRYKAGTTKYDIILTLDGVEIT